MVTATIVTALPKTGRALRNPQHRFSLRHRPWQIQPFVIAPVLPGETMKNLLLQARCVTDPIKNALVGWWAEYYLFYVKHRDLDARDLLAQMVLNPAADLSSLTAAASASTYHAGGSIDWTKLCLDRVTDQYFRDADETVLQAAIDGLPLANVNTPGWWDSAKDATVTPAADAELPGQEAPVVIPGFEAAYAQWNQMRDMKLTAATYEDFLRSYGVIVPRAVDDLDRKPELIRYVRDWSYPSNTVNPLNGTPSSAVSWSIAERADKDRFFKEPGFIFGVTVCRPKVYYSKIKGAGVAMMRDAYSWLPAINEDDPYTSVRNFANTAGPLQGNVTNGYWVDVRDLLLYGDQFFNFAADADMSKVDLPTTAMQRRFASSADADALYVAPAQNKIRQDGVVSINILGRQVDHT